MIHLLRVLAVACALALATTAVATLTLEEKKLLEGAISADAARDAGKATDVAMLERIVELGDPRLVQSWNDGMRHTHTYEMPPQVEAMVVKHFNHPKVGAAIRAISGRYKSRALFDLHLARIREAFESNEPSFGQILNTQQPGVEADLLPLVGKFPGAGAGTINYGLGFVGQRRLPAAVPLLLAELEKAYPDPQTGLLQSPAAPLNLLLNYPDVEIWRQAGARIDALRRDGRIDERAYGQARIRLDPMLADPQGHLARMNSNIARAEWEKRRDAVTPDSRRIYELRKTDLRKYVQEYALRLERLEPIAKEFADEGIDNEMARQYGQIGMVARFELRDRAVALRFLEKGAKGGDMLAQVVLAEMLAVESGDKARALRAYRAALASASVAPGKSRLTPYATPGSPMNEFWKAWLAQEIAFLETGRAFSGRVPEPVIAGFWEVVGVWSPHAGAMIGGFEPPPLGMAHSAMAGGVSRYPAPSMAQAAMGWPNITRALEKIGAKDLDTRLARAPASRLAFLATLAHISALPNPAPMLRELARHDPSGYWTTIALGTVAFHESGGEAGREAALRNGVAEAMPGMAAAGRPNPLAQAATRHLQSRALRVVAKQ